MTPLDALAVLLSKTPPLPLVFAGPDVMPDPAPRAWRSLMQHAIEATAPHDLLLPAAPATPLNDSARRCARLLRVSHRLLYRGQLEEEIHHTLCRAVLIVRPGDRRSAPWTLAQIMARVRLPRLILEVGSHNWLEPKLFLPDRDFTLDPRNHPDYARNQFAHEQEAASDADEPDDDDIPF